MTYLEEAINNICPSDVSCNNAPHIDHNTVKALDGIVIGCRGITCEECWNQEVKDAR